jgi:hypothetical protein
MQNLAGDKEANEVIRAELSAAGITVNDTGSLIPGEVLTTILGALGPFKFRRLWYYWSVTGDVPLSVAEAMYETPIGRRDVRVAGHCGCPPPSEWAERRRGVGLVVKSYHIDTAEGLKLFVDTVRAAGLVEAT